MQRSGWDVWCGSFEGREKSRLLCGEEFNFAPREVWLLSSASGGISELFGCRAWQESVCLEILSYNNVIWGGRGSGSLGISCPPEGLETEVNHVGGQRGSSEGALIKTLDSRV